LQRRHFLLQGLSDLLKFLRGQPERRGTDHARNLLWITHTHDRARHSRVVQCPRDGNFSRDSAMASPDLFQQLDQAQIPREQRFAKIWILQSPVLRSQGRDALPSHATAQQAGIHRRVDGISRRSPGGQ
jgi:hypothetical protein